MQYLPQYSCVHVSALDNSMTDLAYAECVNRDGIHPNEIGEAVIAAVSRLKDPDALSQVIVRFSTDT